MFNKRHFIYNILGNILTIGIISIYAIMWTLIVLLVSHVAVQIVVYFV